MTGACNSSVCKWGAIFLLIGGLVHLIPQVYSWLANLTGGTPWIQMLVGIVSVILALVCLFKGCPTCQSGSCMVHGGEEKK